MLNFVSDNWLLLALAGRASVFLLIVGCVALLCRKASAAAQHFLYFAGLVACILLPLVSCLPFPEMSLAWLPPIDDSNATGHHPHTPASPMRASAIERSFGPSNSPTIAEAKSTSSPSSLPALMGDRTASIQSSASDNASAEKVPPAATVSLTGNSSYAERAASYPWLAVVWCVGTLLVGLRGLFQFMAASRLIRQCSPVGTDWQSQLSHCASQLGLRRSPPCIMHTENVSPMVVGLFRPVIVLPSLAAHWTDQRRRLVLLHELAHVKRRDLLTQALASSACALYWFNPLVWWFAQQMKRLREIACDDLVVAQTSQADQYADVLLTIAKEYRGRCWSGGIAMARINSISLRIGCILDIARKRQPLSMRMTSLVIASLVVITVVINSVALRPQALATELPLANNVQDKPETSQPPAASDTQPETRELKIQVFDTEGKALVDAQVDISVWPVDDKQNFPHRELKTNDEGVVSLPIPRKLNLLRVWARKADYVPLFLGYERGKHDQGAAIPDVLSFRLPTGHRLSGLVVDEGGKPVAGAKVDVSVEVPLRPQPPQPSVDNWLASQDAAVRTDAEGRWTITTAPAKTLFKDYEFSLYITHPDFVGDTRRGEMQLQQAVTSSQLREGTAKIVLTRGTPITGTVTDEKGQPISKGLVVWSDHPYFAEGVNEAELTKGGKFKTINLAPGKYPITILAPGYAPEQKTIQLSPGNSQVNFQLKPGLPLKVKILDPTGQPIPGEHYVGIKQWRGTDAIYNEVHPNVLPSHIPNRADATGLYSWDWAPEDPVEYSFSAQGYDVVHATLVAKAEAHEIRLTRPTTIFGKVVDAQTGQPIPKFRVIEVKAFSPEFYSTNFQPSGVSTGKDGQYSLTVNSSGQTGNRYRVRVEAEGYRTVFGQKDLAIGDPPLEEDFRLEPKPAWTGKVVDAAGQPVTSFKVAVGTASTSPNFSPERIEDDFGIAFAVEGRNDFQLAATFEPMLIRVYNDQGFAEVLRAPDEPIGTIQMQPWSAISGQLVQDSQPISNTDIYFWAHANQGLTEPRFQDNYGARTDKEGRFHFDKLPPQSGRLGAYLGPWEESPLTSSKYVTVIPVPGKTIELTFGTGTKIEGHVKATGRSNDEFSKQWSLNYLIRRDNEIRKPAKEWSFTFNDQGPLQLDWTRQPDFHTWLTLHEHHFVKLDADGNLRVHGVDPGEYELLIQLYEQPVGCLVETVGQVVIPVSVKAGINDRQPISLGDIEVPCRIGPRVGSDMRAYRFTDSAGVVRQVNDLQGTHVLLHVWASWCQPCLQSLPSLRATREKYASSGLMMIGLNMDEDRAAADAIVAREKMIWAQNFLGKQSALAQQLAISSVPSYYLIDADGKLVGSYGDWRDVATELEKRLP